MTEQFNSHDAPGNQAGAIDFASDAVPVVNFTPAQIEQLLPVWKNLELSAAPQPAVRWREVLSVVCIVGLADITFFRGTGFAGAALFVLLTPVLLFLASPAPALTRLAGGLAVLICLTGGRLIWQGSVFTVLAGLLLLVAFAMALARRTPFVLELIGYGFKSWLDGFAEA